MKHVFVLLFLITNSAIGFSQYAEFEFLDKPIYNFGEVDEGVQLKYYFVFKNTGNTPLVINDAAVTCSCTKVTFPSNPILPQKTDSILVRFDTKGKYYKQDRTIKITANTKKSQKLKMRAFVIPKEE